MSQLNVGETGRVDLVPRPLEHHLRDVDPEDRPRRTDASCCANCYVPGSGAGIQNPLAEAHVGQLDQPVCTARKEP